MSDLIPKTADVRDAYSAESVDSTYANRMFDLWLAKYKAKVIAKTEERIIKLLEEQGCDCHNVYCDKMPTAALGSLIALIKEER
jgi:hypothetical protein